jgi:hypothetical protein
MATSAARGTNVGVQWAGRCGDDDTQITVLVYGGAGPKCENSFTALENYSGYETSLILENKCRKDQYCPCRRQGNTVWYPTPGAEVDITETFKKNERSYEDISLNSNIRLASGLNVQKRER